MIRGGNGSVFVDAPSRSPSAPASPSLFSGPRAQSLFESGASHLTKVAT